MSAISSTLEPARSFHSYEYCPANGEYNLHVAFANDELEGEANIFTPRQLDSGCHCSCQVAILEWQTPNCCLLRGFLQGL